MPDLDALVADLRDGTEALDEVIDRAGPGALGTSTPAEGWTVADTLAHLAGFDETAVRALTSPAEFEAEVAGILEEGTDPIAAITAQGRALGDDGSLEWWREARAGLLGAVAGCDPTVRVPWYGPPMSVMSFVTARLMETWAHGQDLRDALGESPEVSDRLRHVAHLGVGARPFSYAIQGREVPPEPVEVVLAGPTGAEWRWGPPDAVDRVSGPALDFCLVVTQRRHLSDVALEVDGPAAVEWMDIAQAFAGAPGSGRTPGQFSGED